MPAKKDKKFERTTSEQIQFYMSFCKAHPEMQGGKCNPMKPSILADLWRELTENLNAMRGPTRTTIKWKESLTQWKSQMRCRARKEKWKNRTTDNESATKSSKDFEKETLQSIEILADDQEEFLHLGLQENSMSDTLLFSELSKAIAEDDQDVLPQLGLQKKLQIKTSADVDACTEIKFGTESNTSSTESTAPTFTFLNTKNKKRKKISPEAMMKEALESLRRREDRELKMWEEMRLQQKQTNQILERLGDSLLNITAVLEKLVKKES